MDVILLERIAKLGQPVPDSNLALERNSGSPHSRQV